MQRIMKHFKTVALMSVVLLGCEVSDFDLQDNPNYLTPESADPEYLLNEIQYLFQSVMARMILNTDDVMRYEAMTDTYADVVSVSVLDGEWESYYEALNNSKTIEALAENDETLLFHNAINKLLMGYLTVTMVDYLGAIPYSEAAIPSEYPNPGLDSGPEIYQLVLEDIDQAIEDIEASTFNFSTDLFYGSDKDKWIAFANSLKLKILVQTRLASSEIGVSDPVLEINALLEKNLIDKESEDFQYTYATIEEPESRHRYFQRGYVSGFGQYMGNYFMFMLKDYKNIRDPRLRYYLYRQSDSNPFGIPPYSTCPQESNVDYCYIGDFYRGLDHGENRTGYGDNEERTVYGLYPGGGTFDEDQFNGAPDTSTHLDGAGILPLLTTSFVKFLRAEAALMLGTNDNPEILLEEAIQASMDKVLDFGNVDSEYEATSEDVEAYMNEVLFNYNNVATDEQKLDIIITEYYLAAFGNSTEAYNAYRRTGYPSNIQVPIDNDNPAFPRSFPYSSNAVEINSSLTQKRNTERVFWDNNPEGFIK
ncbi:SusD/RagB family nutrient-binding outer membrane lipoprotein [Muricauda sp. 334s03]|uniref:SusD/RagB family nutrient-binding outer membrane lipoprotein n=1 Tax=Flagellimonas yonaguniensis TaxID=3031325 RepID=A0ABT5XXS1_9FLAO|nr:SusD/RagB family nutrient-binding outer membrane lipoprotein [[Muricauda] yonaguniensis]MDF0715984.1 SusD/RagB family nutrient-binding outer membrane lipoprotein [[Muricauda] yonaguniensis]